MQKEIVSIASTSIPEQWKSVLIEVAEYIKNNAPQTLTGAYVFGSLARSELRYDSDVDVCLTFVDKTDLRDRHLLEFKGMLRSISLDIPVDVVCCHDSTLQSSDQPLFQEIRRDGRKFV